MSALTDEQVELLRRVRDGASLAKFPLVPHPLEELLLLRSVALVEVDLEGNVRPTERAIECLDDLVADAPTAHDRAQSVWRES